MRTETTMQSYSKQWYWDERYTNESESFDWYQSYSPLAPLTNLYVLTVPTQSSSSDAETQRSAKEWLKIDLKMDVRDMKAFGDASFDDVIDKAEDDPHIYGTPPARKEAVEALASVKIEEGGLQCSVCLEDFEIGIEAKEMPCKHKFHGDCLLMWLELHCSCPICRYELPSYETRTESVRTEPNGNDNGGSESSSSTSSQGSENSHPEQEKEEESDNGIVISIPFLISSLFSSSQGSRNP